MSKAKDDLPDPDKPVITTNWLRGIATSTFLRLCTRAPLMMMCVLGSQFSMLCLECGVFILQKYPLILVNNLSQMKKLLLFFSLLTFGGISEVFAQEPVVIKEEGAVGDLDAEVDVQELPFRKRLNFGGGVSGLSFGNPTSIGISPMVGYSLTNNSIVGIGLTYQYYWADFGSLGSLTSNLLGQRIFFRQQVPALSQVIGQAYLTGQIENFSNLSDNTGINYSNPVLVGVGLGSKIGINLSIMYDLNYSSGRSPYGSPLVVQVGGFFF